MKSQEAVLEQITQNSGNVIVGRFEDYGSGDRLQKARALRRTGNGKERTSRRPFDEKREPLGKECKRKLTSGRSSA